MSAAAHSVALAERRSARFVAWCRAWRAGLSSFDDAIDNIERPPQAPAEEHLATELPGTWSALPLRDALPHLRQLHPDEIRLTLPAPGDPDGLGPGEFTASALTAGEGVLAGIMGLTPQTTEHVSGSGDVFVTVSWQAFEAPPLHPNGPRPTVREADGELSLALQETTTELARLDVARWRPELGSAISALRRPTEAELPPGYDGPARRLYSRALLLERVLILAGQEAPGGSLNAFEAQRRDEALRPLAAASRRAITAAINAPLI
ncbi:hypothetical protein [Hamadaea tsunoensis]|uniref:hypothetical protein n=1 Tax=Hamadaea tsunoensis TaxID=53368 RepID=UPI0004804C4E|nr:hypothetical protein [Hamadaea tsunoensis]